MMTAVTLQIPPSLQFTDDEFVEISPTSLSGEDVLPGFILDLQPIFGS